ncbi:uncharacterized protein LOC144870500 isoform X2 [Branchiostoma floridae x Branchiostoma japonicum]
MSSGRRRDQTVRQCGAGDCETRTFGPARLVRDLAFTDDLWPPYMSGEPLAVPEIMFITVRYGENKSEIFNPKCRVLLLLKAIRDKCGCEHGDTIDLADETGEVMELANHPGDYASNYLHERATFILIKVEKCEGSEEDVRYLPLYKGTGLSKTFLARLNRRRSRISDLVDMVSERRTSHSSRLLSRTSSRRLSVPVIKSTPKSPNKGASSRTGGVSTAPVKRDLVTGLKKSS